MIEYNPQDIVFVKPNDTVIDINRKGTLRYLESFERPLTKHYYAGMYGGKFLPMHKGHLYCLEQASQLCDHVYLILFYGGFGERVVRMHDDRDILGFKARMDKLLEVAERFSNVIPRIVDVTDCVTPEGNEDWDAETPLVLDVCGEKFGAVFGSEPVLYTPYFSRAYPWADHVIVDAKRKHVPISATDIRNMSEEEGKKWLA